MSDERAHVDLWWVRLDRRPAGAERGAALLDAQERARMSAFKDATARERFVARRCALRQVLGSYADVPPAAVRLVAAPGGKPYAPDLPDVQFSSSSSGRHAVFAVTVGHAVGVDLEQIADSLDDIVRNFFSPHEQAELGALPPPARLRSTYRCWTMKEAYLKALGIGLRADLGAFTISTRGRARDALVQPLAADDRRWTIATIAAPAGCTAALAVDADDVGVVFRRHESVPHAVAPMTSFRI